MLHQFLKRKAFKIMASREPDFVIGAHRNPPYIKRWWVIPRNRFFNIYLHAVGQDDDDRAMHDHPWINMSYILEGGYNECTPKWTKPLTKGQHRFRRPRALHRLELLDNQYTLSLFITGPKVRKWGFQTEDGWVSWEDFVSPAEGGNGRCLGELYDKGQRI